VVCEYDGWPNGLKLRPDHRVLVADHKNGLIEIDGRTGIRSVSSG
jgi:gluconolactonase